MDSSLGRQNFYQEINQQDEHINLAKAALYFSQEEYPNLNPSEYIDTIDAMADEVKQRLPQQRYPLRIINTINHYLYEELGFRGNRNDYYDPRNSFLNVVLSRRIGIPITLSLVYLEIARRIEFPMVGIGMPGHFLIRPEFEGVGIFVDAFNQGETLFEQDCEERLRQIYQQPVTLEPRFLETVTHRQFLARMLTNLKVIYFNREDLPRALAAVEQILLLFPDDAKERRDRGLLYYHLGEAEKASQDLEIYLAMLPHAEDAEIIRQLLAQIW
ncbi:MAG: hypothetical protein BRC44_11760 [Cyanobacteria bacterium QS_4_48_99]|nr:MAG: hypothetical protein BRC44_11760 [Cyanobacteria bacterium QS_4_48_99]